MRNSLIRITDVPPPTGAPVPVNDTVTVAVPALMVSTALFAPTVVGWNVTEAVVDAFAASVVTDGSATLNWPAFVPVIANGVSSVMLPALVFLIVRFKLLLVPVVTVPNAIGDGVAVNTPPTVIVYEAVPGQPSAAVASTVTVALPETVGVPDTTPVLLSVRPAGSDPAARLKAYGAAPPLAVSVCEYAAPTTAVGSAPPMLIAWHAGPVRIRSLRLRGRIW